LRRFTISNRVRAKLREVKTELMRRRHLPVPEQGQWLASVVRGHLAYYAVPGNSPAVNSVAGWDNEFWSSERAAAAAPLNPQASSVAIDDPTASPEDCRALGRRCARSAQRVHRSR